jgi:hypothetical protein
LDHSDHHSTATKAIRLLLLPNRETSPNQGSADRALNKNKKPDKKNKNRACNYFLGSFGSPCSFQLSSCPSAPTALPPTPSLD